MVNAEIGRFAHQVTIRAAVLTFVLVLLLVPTGKPALPQGLAAGAVVDIGTFYLLAEVAYRLFQRSKRWISASALMGFFTLRIFLQVAVLYLALVYSSILNFWTTLIGVLAVHVMIFTQAIIIRFHGRNRVIEGDS
jgi:hypothetical protein